MHSVEAGGLDIGDDHPPRIMGVLNISEESPYDPSVFADPGEAARYVDEDLIADGADVVDVGLESANKRFEVMSAEEELARLDAAVEVLESTSGDAVFSIETRYHEVADEALSRGFDMVNDICGFADPRMPEVCAEHEAAVVKMAGPDDLERPGAVEEVDWAARRSPEWAAEADYVDMVYEALKYRGLPETALVDPAFGGWSEAKTLADDRETFRRLREFRGLGRPILVSINRKNFLREVVGRETEAALPVSLGATAMAVERGARVIRTHDVAETRDAARIGDELGRERVEDSAHGIRELDLDSVTAADRHLERVGGDLDPAEAVLEAYELCDLAPATRERLASVAPEHGLAVAGEECLVVFGTPAAFERAAAAVASPPELGRVLDRLRNRIR